ncbi:hypothetical protein BKH46_08390 [Helicobacter sp. 12S02634-8]|uniref:Panacea domain-containing protein n=1 Tax=Helicobacter sp. 12S02634-8 TaxID=1476199 RepID=UPI000BA666FB|nr:type II toxin-antitoxin system antitoxin SocA domain-containing protein [Helicobacter sp. 12S02634-8]PAF46248.1 hypothetical protein BKH46_08390 [Helicobacter sp. 12S02634-8]
MEAIDVARYFVTLNDMEYKEELSKSKVQELLYYAQGYYLALYGEPLFEEEIEAWKEGLVVYKVFARFKKEEVFIPAEKFRMTKKEVESIEPRKRELIRDVFDLIGQYSDWKLREKIPEFLWKSAYQEGINNVISKECLREYFKLYVNNNGKIHSKPCRVLG